MGPLQGIEHRRNNCGRVRAITDYGPIRIFCFPSLFMKIPEMRDTNGEAMGIPIPLGNMVISLLNLHNFGQVLR